MAVLERWRAQRCLSGAWLVAAPTTSRIVYDSLAATLTDADRLLVCELDATALWYNLRASRRVGTAHP